MDSNKIFTNGGVYYNNPNYKDTKKNKEPKQLFTQDVNTSPNPGASALYDNTNMSFQTNDGEKYSKMGIMYNRAHDIDKELIDSQAGVTKIMHGLEQGVVSDGILGIGIGFSDLSDFITGRAFSPDNNYKNDTTKYLTGLQDEFNNNVAPVYADPSKNILNGGLIDAGWWGKNIPSIMSSLALLIPADMVTVGLGKLVTIGKGASIAGYTRKAISGASKILAEATGKEAIATALNSEKAIQTANTAMKIGTTALISRTMENYQEGRGVYNDMYKESYDKLTGLSDSEYKDFVKRNKKTLEGVDTSDKDAVSKKIAKTSADQDFIGNYANIMWDVIELYGLKDMFGSKGLNEVGRASARRANIESINYAGKSAEEIAKLKASKSLLTKSKEKVSDALLGSKFAVAAQLSEGAEEAWNYIQQEEGMHLGRTMLGTEQLNNLDTRLASYAKSPQLWESIFWGVAGGVMFQAGGSKLNRVKNTIYDYAAEKASNNKENPETGEHKVDASWKGLSQLPEVRRKVADIQARKERADILSSKLKMIDEGVNPNSPDQKITSQEEKDIITQNVKTNFIIDTALSSMNNGTYDLTREYFNSDTVKKAFEDTGIVKPEESSSWKENTLGLMDKVKDNYNSEFVKLNNMSSKLDKRLPIEFLNIMATENVYHKIGIENAEHSKNISLGNYNTELAAVNEKLNPNVDYNSLLEFGVNNDILYSLYKKKSELNKSIKEKDSLTDRIALKNINDKIGVYRSNLNENQLAYSLMSINDSLSKEGSKDEDLDKELMSIIDVNTNKIKDNIGLDENKRFKELINGSVTENRHEEVKKLAQLYHDNITNPKTGIESIGNLADKYYSYLKYDNTVKEHKAQLVSSLDDVKYASGVINNSIDVMRVNSINNSYKDIIDLSNIYGSDTIKQAIVDNYNGKPNEEVTKNITDDKHKESLANSLQVLNFTNAANINLYENLSSILDINDFNNEVAKSNAEKKNIVPIQGGDGVHVSELNNQSTESSKSNTANANGIGDNVSTKETTNLTKLDEIPQPQGPKPISSDNSISDLPPMLQPVTNTNVTPNNNIDSSVHISLSDDKVNINTNKKNNSDIEIPLTLIEDESNNKSDNGDTFNNSNTNDNNNKSFQLTISAIPINKVGPLLDNDKLFDKKPGVSLMDDNFKIIKNPVVKISENSNNDTKYEIIEKGVISLITDEDGDIPPVKEDNNIPTSPTTSDNTPTSSPEITPTSNDTETKAEETPISSTGDLEDTSKSTNKITSTPFETETQANAQIQKEQVVASYFAKHVNFKDDNIDFDKIAEVVSTELKNDYPQLNDEDIAKFVEFRVNNLKQTHEQIKAIKSKLGAAAAGLTFASKIEDINTTDYSNLFTSAMDNFVENYTKTLVVPTIEGKPIIDLKDILYICSTQNSSEDKELTTSMYNLLKKYLISPVGLAKYKVVNMPDVISGKILDDLYKTDDEIYNENNEIDVPARINLFENFAINGEEDEETLAHQSLIEKTVNSINEGDKLTVKHIKNKIQLIKNGVPIGSMTKPKLDSDGYVQYNEGWRTQVSLGVNGEIISPLKDIFRNIFTNDNVYCDELREIIAKVAIDGKEITQSVIDKFSNNPIISKLVQETLVDNENGKDGIIFVDRHNSDKIPYKDMIYHLSKLWNYTKLSKNTSDLNINRTNINHNLNRWFDKLYKSYDAVTNVTDDSEIEVAYVNEGQINRIINDDSESIMSHYAELKIPSEAFNIDDDNEVGLLRKLSIVDPMNINGLIVSGKPNEMVDGRWSRGSTLVTVYSRNTKPDFVKAIGITLSSNENNPVMNKIKSAINSHLDEVLNKFLTDNNSTNLQEVEDAIRSIINVSDTTDRIPLFRAVSGNFFIKNISFNGDKDANAKNIKGIQLIYRDNSGNFKNLQIYSNGKFGPAVGYRGFNSTNQVWGTEERPLQAKDIRESIMKFIEQTSNINISANGIKADNAPKEYKGFITFKDDTCHLDINSKENSYNEQYTSYNDYILYNNLIKVNTFVGDNGSNFNSKGDNQTANKVVYVNLPQSKKEVKSVPKNVTNDTIEESSDRDTYSAIKTIIENNEDTKVFDLLETVFGNEYTERINSLKEQYGITTSLFPENIRFDYIDRFSNNRWEGNIAEVNSDGKHSKYTIYKDGVKSSATAQQGEVIIGQHFINLLASTSLFKRNMAVRKLLHERIHQLLIEHKSELESGNKTPLTVAQEIYDTFRENIDRDLKEKPEDKLLNYLDASTRMYDGDRLLEEFLVESMTNSNFIDYMNSIKVEDVGTEGKGTLLTKFINFINNLFGFKMKDDSLLKKEFNLLSNLLNQEDGIIEADLLKSMNENSNATKDTINEDFDLSMFNIDQEVTNDEEDNDLFASNTEEIDRDVNDINISSIKAYISSFNYNEQNEVKELIDDGFINIKCS